MAVEAISRGAPAPPRIRPLCAYAASGLRAHGAAIYTPGLSTAWPRQTQGSMRPNESPTWLLIVAFAASLMACSTVTEGETAEEVVADVAVTPDVVTIAFTPIDQLTVDTGVSNDGPEAGETIEVFCTVAGLVVGQATPETHWEIYDTPPGMEGAPLVNGNLITFDTAGFYQIRCSITETEWVDPTATKVWVRPGAALNVETEVVPDVLSAGELAEVTCSGADSFGNEVTTGWEVDVAPGGDDPGITGGLVASGLKVKALNVGTYDVSCRQLGGSVDDTPAQVWVDHALPHRLVTTLGAEAIVAGESTSVSCHAEDKFGNVVPDLPMTIALPSALAMAGFDVSGTLTGKYVVKCVPAALEWTAFDLVHAVLEVLPADPVSLELVASPPAPFYPTFTVVEIQVIAHDIYDNFVPDPVVDPFEISPEGLPFTNPSDTNFIFLEEGLVTLTTRLTDDPAMEASIDLAIEGDPPTVAVTYPLRGATIAASKPSITVTGLANDTVAGIVSVRVNGQEAAIHGDGTWTAIFIPKWGLNVLHIEAEDEAGKTSDITQSFYFAESYRPLEPSIPYVEDGVKLWLDDELIDDGVHNPTHPDDLATILEAVLGGFDINGVLPTGMDIGGGYQLHMGNASMNPPSIYLDPIWGGIQIDTAMKNFSVDVVLAGECKVLGIDLCPDVSGTVQVGLLELTADLLAHAENADLQVLLTNTDVEITALDIDINGILGWLFDWLLDFIVGLFTNMIEDAFEDQLGDLLGDTLADVLDALAISETFEIASPLPGMDDIVLNLETRVHSLVFTPDGGRLGLGARVDGVKKVPHTILGAIARGSCLKGYPVQWNIPGTSSFEVALFDDFLNLALAAIWHGGTLQMSLDAEAMSELMGDGGADGLPLPVDDLALNLDWSLPPIINGCDPSGVMTIQVGDLLVDLDLYSPLFGEEGVGKLGLYAAIEVTAEILIIEGDEGDEFAIQIHEMKRFDVDWVTVPEILIGAEESLENLIETELIGKLMEDLAAEPIGGFAIPEIDLSSVSSMIPEGVVIEPTIESLERDSGHTLLSGDLK
jgi:hypothetical protein